MAASAEFWMLCEDIPQTRESVPVASSNSVISCTSLRPIVAAGRGAGKVAEDAAADMGRQASIAGQDTVAYGCLRTVA